MAKVNAAGTALVYCGYIGGSDDDFGNAIAVDSSGNAYVTGQTFSTEATFPVTVGPDLTYNDVLFSDAFVAKVKADGTALVYCGYIGGNDEDQGNGIAVDSSGNAYVTGFTYSTQATFPVTVGPDLTFNNPGLSDAFVAKVNAAGTALVYCGYIGGSDDDFGNAIAVDGSGNAYVTGYTFSTEATFPKTVGPDLTSNGLSDAFVAKVNAAGTALVYCGYIGGSNDDQGNGIAVDGSGNAYVTGFTASTQATFPVTVGPDLTSNGLDDAFVAKVNAGGTALAYCGYIGGSGVDQGNGIAVDSAGNAYVTGITASTQTTFPVTLGPDLTYNGGGVDAFVVRIVDCSTKPKGDVNARRARGLAGHLLSHQLSFRGRPSARLPGIGRRQRGRRDERVRYLLPDQLYLRRGSSAALAARGGCEAASRARTGCRPILRAGSAYGHRMDARVRLRRQHVPVGASHPGNLGEHREPTTPRSVVTRAVSSASAHTSSRRPAITRRSFIRLLPAPPPPRNRHVRVRSQIVSVSEQGAPGDRGREKCAVREGIYNCRPTAATPHSLRPCYRPPSVRAVPPHLPTPRTIPPQTS